MSDREQCAPRPARGARVIISHHSRRHPREWTIFRRQGERPRRTPAWRNLAGNAPAEMFERFAGVGRIFG